MGFATLCQGHVAVTRRGAEQLAQPPALCTTAGCATTTGCAAMESTELGYAIALVGSPGRPATKSAQGAISTHAVTTELVRPMGPVFANPTTHKDIGPPMTARCVTRATLVKSATVLVSRRVVSCARATVSAVSS